MLDEILLWDLTDSPYCRKARICLAWKGVPYRRVTLTLGGRSALRRLSPLGRVPVLVHGTEVVADSTAIARHVERHWPEPALVPDDPAARAYCALVEDWADEALGTVVGAFLALDPANRHAAVQTTASELTGGRFEGLIGSVVARRMRRRYRALGFAPSSLGHFEDRMRADLATLAALLAGRSYLIGRAPTLADVAVFVQLARVVPLAQTRLLDEVPAVRDWMARVEALPAVIAAA